MIKDKYTAFHKKIKELYENCKNEDEQKILADVLAKGIIWSGENNNKGRRYILRATIESLETTDIKTLKKAFKEENILI